MAETDISREKPDQVSSGLQEGLSPLLQKKRTQIVWSVAGFDPSSGAGVTADLMTFAAFGLFGCSALTALTVQTTVGVFRCEPVDSGLLADTLQRLEEDLPAAGVKLGMLGTGEAARVVASFLERRRSQGKNAVPVVLDPVLRSSSGKVLFPDAGLDVFREALLPEVDWITPNWSELAVLADARVGDFSEAERAARRLMKSYEKLGIVVTGGDQREPVDLLLLPNGATHRLSGTTVETTATHGTGCAFSSAFLASLVLGASPLEAAREAKGFVEGALRAAPGLGAGRGPMELLWPMLNAMAAAN